MKILSLELHGYKRMLLNNIDRIKLVPDNKIQLILGTNGSGKAQPLSSAIKIPNGWDSMSNMKVGTEVIAKDGSVAKVTGIHPQGKKEIFKVIFADGRIARVTSDHLWKLYTGDITAEEFEIKTTSDINNYLHCNESSNFIWIDLPDSELNKDTEVPYSPYVYGIMHGLMKKKSVTTSIPTEYLNGSTDQRLDIIKGLMDACGSVCEDGLILYRTRSLQMAKDVVYLIRSLGGIATLSNANHNSEYTAVIKYKTPGDLFTLSKKKNKALKHHEHLSNLKLRVISVEHDGYEEAQCISIDHPDKLYITNDFVVTHNSSLIKELSPLPAIPKEYTKDGLKIITIDHDNSTYVLKSDFRDKAPAYSFMKDDEELNTGLTVTVYKELVSKNFNITPEIHDLLIGKTVFHMMTIAERRSWFTKISDVDYTFAIRYYNKIKEQGRDISGGIKLARSRLVHEQDKLLDKEETERLKKEAIELHKLLDSILILKTTNTLNIQDSRKALESHENVMRSLSETILAKTKTLSNLGNLSSLDELKMTLFTTEAERVLAVQSSEKIWNSIEERKQFLKDVELTDSTNLVDVDNKLDTLLIDIAAAKKTLFLDIDYSNSNSMLDSLSGIKSSIAEITNSLIKDPKRELNRNYYESLTADRTEHDNKLYQLDKNQLRLIRRKDELEHLKQHANETCPKCRHVWTKGFSPEEYSKLLVSIEEGSKAINKTKSLVESLDVEISRVVGYSNDLKELKSIMKGWSILNPLWSHISTEGYIFDNPEYISIVLDNCYSDLTIMQGIMTNESEVEDLLIVKKAILTTKDQDIQKLKDEISELDKELHIQQTLAKNKTTRYENLKFCIDNLNTIDDYKSKLETVMIEHSKCTEEIMESYRQEALNISIKDIKLKLSEIESKLAKLHVQDGIVANLKEDLTKMESEYVVYKALIKELSMNEGLIAKGLQGFINSFVSKVNNFIRKIWLYPMELVPVAMDTDSIELDYKFIVKVSDNIVINDVKEGSSAMREIINLAFRVISMQYLGLTTAPLYLDEFGTALDEGHRESAHYAIANLLNTSDFSQIYMVSHYTSSHGSFTNADITVLDSSNLTLPENTAFNRAVEIN